ncbi:T9SS type A sorting domain-containing protein [Ferruginibacter albus]|uniref:T9SS type A sorting domain-containing protein n=1 Tax=Ferruginibacter albus TaxID=2875540 RepID=UPI001CC480F6|nr:T9SS type A sorting domain-containing protein [Ferruginibacter albus]UAY53047.1 T9SS type A sorting domain-containing protein [Ferruginibacter albus]
MKNFITKTLVLLSIAMQFATTAKTQTISMSSPSANGSYINTVSLAYSVAPTSSPIKNVYFVFTYTSGFYTSQIGQTWTVTFNTVTPTKSRVFYANYLSRVDTAYTVTTTSTSSDTSMPSGTYTVKAFFTRTDNGIIFSSAPVTITLSVAALPPTLTLPASNSYVNNNFKVISNVNQTPRLSGFPKTLYFIKGPGDTTTIQLSVVQIDTFNININDIAGSNPVHIRSSTPNTLALGTYTVVLGIYDNLGHLPKYDTSFNVTIDTTKIPATITSPTTGALFRTNFDVSFILPKTALPNSTKLVFQKVGVSDTLAISDTASGNHTITIDPAHLLLSSNGISSSYPYLEAGQYSLQVIYTDLIYDTTISAPITFQLQTDTTTITPTLILPANNGSDVSTSHISFTLPENALANSVQVEFVGCNDNIVTLDAVTKGAHTYALNGADFLSSEGVVSAVPNQLPTGTYLVLLSYQDTTGNPRSYMLAKNYAFNNAVLGLNLDMLKGVLQLAKTHLQWETATENNVAYFDVQYSKDARNFSDVGKVKAVGTSYVKRNYSFIHNDPSADKNYYRLKIFNDNGSFSYSPTILIYKGAGTNEFKVFPNPAKDKLNVTIITSNTIGTHTLNVWDVDGKLVKTISVEASSGSNLFTVPINDLNSGNYVLQDGNNVSFFQKNK